MKFQKSKVYAWVKWDGTFLLAPSTSLESLKAQKDFIQRVSDDTGQILRLIEFKFAETKDILFPPPDPEEDYRVGGSAIGGGYVGTIEQALEDLKRIFNKQYKATDVEFWLDDNKAFAEYGNVRCWIALTDNQEMDAESNSRKKWSSYVTMLSGWTDDYHDSHVGDFCHGCVAVEETFLAFIKFQLSEQTIDDFF
jgi:hypothetical protein